MAAYLESGEDSLDSLDSLLVFTHRGLLRSYICQHDDTISTSTFLKAQAKQARFAVAPEGAKEDRRPARDALDGGQNALPVELVPRRGRLFSDVAWAASRQLSWPSITILHYPYWCADTQGCLISPTKVACARQGLPPRLGGGRVQDTLLTPTPSSSSALLTSLSKCLTAACNAILSTLTLFSSSRSSSRCQAL